MPFWIRRTLLAPSALLAAATIAVAIKLYAPDADGAFAIYDGAWYAHYGERFPRHSILPHHPLFHVIVALLARLLVAVQGVGAGHVAVRIVAGLGGAAVLLQIASLAGPGRKWIGFAFAFALFATRGFIAEAATGENLFPAYFATLLVLQCATAPSPSLWKLGAAITLAACFRQDNLLVLPGALIAAGSALPAGRRVRPLMVMLAIAGVATLGFYVACWTYARHALGEDLITYLTRFGHTARYRGPTSFTINAMMHFGSLGAAVVGRFWFSPVPHIAIGLAWVALVAVAGWLCRGTSASRRFATAVLLTIAIRMPFFAWFEPNNFEWQLLPMTLLVALGARTARGEPAVGSRSRAAGLAILVVTAIVTLALHAPNTLELRQRRLAQAIDVAIASAPPDAYYLPMDKNAMLGLELRGRQYDQLDIPYEASVEMLSEIAHATRAEMGRPIVMVGDRFVETGMQYDLLHAGEGFGAFDAAPAHPDVKIVSFEGKPFAAILKGP